MEQLFLWIDILSFPVGCVVYGWYSVKIFHGVPVATREEGFLNYLLDLAVMALTFFIVLQVVYEESFAATSSLWG